MEMPHTLLRENLLAWRDQLAKEVGTEAPCPMCQTPRVTRSDYIRCNQCGVNWLQGGENQSLDPRVERYHALMATARSKSASTSKEAADPS